MKTIRFEQMLDCQVHDPAGKRVGRILAVTVDREGEDRVVREYMLGTAALLTRLGLSAGRLVGVPIRRKPLCIPWDQLDASDPAKLRLRRSLEELKQKA